MTPRPFAAITRLTIICLTIAAATSCKSSDGGGPTPDQSRQQIASQANANASTPATAATPAPTAAPAGNADALACKLLTSEEIQAVQGEGVRATKGTDAATGPLAVSQCFYETASFANSVSLTLTRKNKDAKGEGPREFWRRNFGGGKGRDKEERDKEEREKEEREKAGAAAAGEEEEEGLPPTPVKGIGDEAYWVGNSKVGTLYVLKGDKFIRISVGGADPQDKKMEKSKTLAQSALKRV